MNATMQWFTHQPPTPTPQCRIYASVNWVSVGSDNGLSLVRRQAITWTNAGSLSIEPLGTNFSEIRIEKKQLFMHENVFENVVCKFGGHFVQGEMS